MIITFILTNPIYIHYYLSMRRLDLKGQKFNRLTVLEYSHNEGAKVMWKCRCDCGNITFVSSSNLRCNRTKSCGCFKLEEFSKRFTKHNQRHTKLYEIWKGIKNRCLNPNHSSFHNYGGRGITICDEWKNDFVSFYNWSMQNGYIESVTTIDRINNDGNYEPSNCRWTDRKTQANNTRTNHYITYQNQTLTLKQWSEKINISYSCLLSRLKHNWSIEKALTTPAKK